MVWAFLMPSNWQYSRLILLFTFFVLPSFQPNSVFCHGYNVSWRSRCNLQHSEVDDVMIISLTATCLWQRLDQHPHSATNNAFMIPKQLPLAVNVPTFGELWVIAKYDTLAGKHTLSSHHWLSTTLIFRVWTAIHRIMSFRLYSIWFLPILALFEYFSSASSALG